MKTHPRFDQPALRPGAQASAAPGHAGLKLAALVLLAGVAAWAAHSPAVAAEPNATATDAAPNSASAPAGQKATSKDKSHKSMDNKSMDKSMDKRSIEKGDRQPNDSKRTVPPKTKAASAAQ